LDFLMGRIGVYYVEYVNPFIVMTACLINPIIGIVYACKYP